MFKNACLFFFVVSFAWSLRIVDVFMPKFSLTLQWKIVLGILAENSAQKFFGTGFDP